MERKREGEEGRGMYTEREVRRGREREKKSGEWDEHGDGYMHICRDRERKGDVGEDSGREKRCRVLIGCRSKLRVLTKSRSLCLASRYIVGHGDVPLGKDGFGSTPGRRHVNYCSLMVVAVQRQQFRDNTRCLLLSKNDQFSLVFFLFHLAA